MKISEG